MLKQSVTPYLVVQYFDLLSSGYRQRNKLFSSCQHDYNQLIRWDSLLTGYLQGLTLLPEAAEEHIQDVISESLLNKGNLFTIALYALAINSGSYLHAILTLAQTSVEFDEAVRDAILWAPQHSVLWDLLPDYPLYHAWALTARPDIKINPAINLRHFSTTGASVLTAGALMAIYQRNSTLYFRLIEQLLSEKENAKITAIASLLTTQAYYAYKTVIKEALYQLTQSSQPAIAEYAAKLLIVKSFLSAKDYLDFLANDVRNHRLYINALGLYGDAAVIPELARLLEEKEFARLCAMTIYTITGSLPEKDGWAGEAPDTENASLSLDVNGFPVEDPDVGLTWPDKHCFDRWWAQNRSRFAAGHRYLAGKDVRDSSGIASLVQTESLYIAGLAASRLSDKAPALSEWLRLPACKGMPQLLRQHITAPGGKA
ncbi:hypothetical protein [Mixta intestinalis]|uniref:Uncharacterized protein n=1 Tax=Mixta intestinalis TaxID=1615494 RepID=A0A6P1PXG8_9GAMM|nr:hypothetical protein [Mixta intestinalis]QHM71256.1 hypothetical protein C7M51_01541 [Mixta intestinalis]